LTNAVYAIGTFSSSVLHVGNGHAFTKLGGSSNSGDVFVMKVDSAGLVQWGFNYPTGGTQFSPFTAQLCLDPQGKHYPSVFFSYM